MDKNLTAFSVVELEQESNGETVIANNHLFSTWDKAMAFLHARYLDVRLKVDFVGEHSADFDCDKGWYFIVDKEGNSFEGRISKCLTLDADITPEMEEDWKESNQEG